MWIVDLGDLFDCCVFFYCCCNMLVDYLCWSFGVEYVGWVIGSFKRKMFWVVFVFIYEYLLCFLVLWREWYLWSIDDKCWRGFVERVLFGDL